MVQEINEEFTLAEFDAVQKKTKNSTCEEDGVTPLKLKNLPRNGKRMLLKLLNRSWDDG